jgi:carbon-monoxide dehydrogenase medium subunit|tara:strand:+ start:144 stop:1016 length:873 start_codon:yes stop_codon:yes gene_type:complete
MMRFEYFEPDTLDEAVTLLGQYAGKASLMAGGTDLLVEIKEHLHRPDYVINIKKICDLDALTYNNTDGLTIGSLTTVRAVETSPVVLEKYAGLAQAARHLGSIQVRNRATVAGNICRASPSADTLPPLIADEATLKLYGPGGERVLPMEVFFTGPRQTQITKDEILTEIVIPPPPPHTGKAYIKHGRRKAMELATVGVGVSLTLDGDFCREVRIVLGAVAPTPIRAWEAEATLRGTVIDEALIEAAAVKAMEVSRPISDVRSSAVHRRKMVHVQTRRVIALALSRARSDS